ncbi:MAG: hypothetical protein P9M15_08070 [Candidatus Electryoneaceae bacterium]|nr:hypothetical protein [Candidatus Electryoneaceae bacterium]
MENSVEAEEPPIEGGEEELDEPIEEEQPTEEEQTIDGMEEAVDDELPVDVEENLEEVDETFEGTVPVADEGEELAEEATSSVEEENVQRPYDISRYLQAGQNLFAIAVSASDTSRYGMIFGLTYYDSMDVQHNVVTTPYLSVWHSEEPDFHKPDYDDEDWRITSSKDDYEPQSNTEIWLDLQATSVWYSSERPLEPGLPELPDTTVIDTQAVIMALDMTGVDTLGQAQADARRTQLQFEHNTELGAARRAYIANAKEVAIAELVELERERLRFLTMDIERQRDSVAYEISIADSVWNLWMGQDDFDERPYWFRHTFEIEARPSAGHIWLTADDNFDLYINGTFISRDEADSVDWMMIKDYNIGEYLHVGSNSIAIVATDVDSTRNGIMVGLIYETIPDMEGALEQLVTREQEAQERALDEAEIRRSAHAEDDAIGDIEEATHEELHDLRAIEKNRLR